jgi:D-alanine--poly(phosphoribitol) ligase subunit 1
LTAAEAGLRLPDAIDLFLAAAASRPDHPAISLRGQIITYAELERRARRFAAAFSGHGAGVLVALPQGPDAYAAILGAGLAGCYYAGINVEAPAEKRRRVVKLLRPDIIVAEPEMAAALAPDAPDAHFVAPDGPEAAGALFAGNGTRHEIAYIIFTSGSTGTPKGVVIGRVALNHFVDWVKTSGFITPEDRVSQFPNIAFDVSITDIFGGLAIGATLCPLLGRADRMFPARVVAREKITVWNSTPSVMSLMMRAGEANFQNLGTLRLLNFCGEPLFPAQLDAIFAAIPDTVVQNSYGPTETTVTMTELRMTRHDYRAACGATVAIGHPIAGIGMYLIGGPHADEGELVITGPQLADGYWQDPEKTAASFRTIEIDGVPVRAYFSGDWAERRGAHIFFRERVDLQVKIHGVRIELDEVGKAIQEAGYPVVCVLKWRDELAAVIEQHPDRAYDETALRAALATRLEKSAMPEVIRPIDRIPRSENDKLDRKAVVAWLDEQAGQGTTTP